MVMGCSGRVQLGPVSTGSWCAECAVFAEICRNLQGRARDGTGRAMTRAARAAWPWPGHSQGIETITSSGE